MKGSVMNVLPSLIAIVLVLSNIETTECRLIKNYKKENDYSHSTNNRSYEAHIQDNAQIRAVPAQQMVSLLPNQPCYTQFFVNGNPPRGLRSGNNILQHMRYICQQVNGQVYYATMFDQSHGIAVFSAYVVTATNVNFNTNNQRPAPSWTQTPGITRQGSDAIYHGQQFDKGHLLPGATYSSTRDSVRSTYVYTNAVPQKPSFNRGQWCQFEKRIRAYAPQCTNNGGRLYLMTGTSFRHIQNTAQGTNTPPVAQLGPVVRGRTTYPAISIPNLMWTAGCCVLQNGQAQSFAVLGNNLQTAAQMLTTQIPVSFLENILLQDVLHHTIGGPAVSLFPGNAACSNMQNNIQNLPAAQG